MSPQEQHMPKFCPPHPLGWHRSPAYPQDGPGKVDLDHGKHLRAGTQGTIPAQPQPSGWGRLGQVGCPHCSPSPGSSGVPQPTQTQPVMLCEVVLAVQASQDLSSPHSPAKAEGKG